MLYLNDFITKHSEPPTSTLSVVFYDMASIIYSMANQYIRIFVHTSLTYVLNVLRYHTLRTPFFH